MDNNSDATLVLESVFRVLSVDITSNVCTTAGAIDKNVSNDTAIHLVLHIRSYKLCTPCYTFRQICLCDVLIHHSVLVT